MRMYRHDITGGDQGVGYSDQSFPGRNNDNGVDSLGVAQGTISDLNGGFGDIIAVIGASLCGVGFFPIAVMQANGERTCTRTTKWD